MSEYGPDAWNVGKRVSIIQIDDDPSDIDNGRSAALPHPVSKNSSTAFKKSRLARVACSLV
jgi:hypothetical protein